MFLSLTATSNALVGPSLDVMVTLAQTSVAVIVPKAALMSFSDGLHPRGVDTLV